MHPQKGGSWKDHVPWSVESQLCRLLNGDEGCEAVCGAVCRRPVRRTREDPCLASYPVQSTSAHAARGSGWLRAQQLFWGSAQLTFSPAPSACRNPVTCWRWCLGGERRRGLWVRGCPVLRLFCSVSDCWVLGHCQPDPQVRG